MGDKSKLHLVSYLWEHMCAPEDTVHRDRQTDGQTDRQTDRQTNVPTDQRTMLEEARKLTSSREILLWMTPSEAPKALQASECSELLDPMRASCWIFAQH